MMRIYFRSTRVLAFVCLAALAMAPHSLGSGKYRRFPETLSPDGAYVLAWGARDHPGDSLRGMKDISATPERVFNMETPNDQPPSFDNYLVDAVNGRVLATLPNSHNTAGPEGSQNHFSLYAAWSPDSKTGVAIYDFRWGSAAVNWMEPRSRSAIDIGGQLYAAVRRLLTEKKKWRKSFVVNFSNPAVPERHTLIVNALAWIPKSSTEDFVNYRMKFHISSDEGKASVKLEKFRPVRESDEAFNSRGMDHPIVFGQN
jgi:hypothetical protein